MRGGSVETDYDVICRCPDGVTPIRRHGRDMLVLQDSEQAACFAPWKPGHVLIVQGYGGDGDDDLEQIVARIAASAPAASFEFDMVDSALRLLVGADDGDGGIYGFDEVACPAGPKACHVYYFDDMAGHATTLSPLTTDATRG
jgi:hypothetical protein